MRTPQAYPQGKTKLLHFRSDREFPAVGSKKEMRDVNCRDEKGYCFSGMQERGQSIETVKWYMTVAMDGDGQEVNPVY
jgi:hypothetical protein